MTQWKLVPCEPTEEMVISGNGTLETVQADDVYRAMIAASPPAPDVVGALDGLENAFVMLNRVFQGSNVGIPLDLGFAIVEARENARAILAQLKGEKL